MTNKLAKNQSQHFNINLTAKYLCLKKMMLLTLKATIDWGAKYHSHQSFTNHRNWTNLEYRCDLQSHSVGPLHISCLNTWQPYCSPSLTNQDTNYNPRKTLVLLLRQYRYLTTINLCLLMWNHFLPVFHFNWLYSVLWPLNRNLPLDYHNQQKTALNLNLCLTLTSFQYYETLQTVPWNSHGVACVCCCHRNCDVTSRLICLSNSPTNDIALIMHQLK